MMGLATIADAIAKILQEATWWDVLGYAGQLIFASRFLVQWIASERRKESVVPVSFWYLSIVGSLLSLAYALTTRKIPFILGYLLNCIPYFRNLVLIHRKNRSVRDPRDRVSFVPPCAHADPVVAVCRRCGTFDCATCARPREGRCATCATAVPA